MAEESCFFNSVNGDRQYDMEAFALYFKQFLSNGIYHTDQVPSLRVRHISGLQTELEPGSAYIEGYMYRNTEPIVFEHDSGDETNPRIDRIILRLDRDMNARYIKAFVKKGIPATNPQPPTLTRNDVVYEISLAQVRVNRGASVIASVLDERLDPSVAGLVSSLITVPTEQFLDDWNNWMAEMEDRKEGYQQEWDDWFTGIQNEIGVRVLIGENEPDGAVQGDIWLQPIG